MEITIEVAYRHGWVSAFNGLKQVIEEYKKDTGVDPPHSEIEKFIKQLIGVSKEELQ